VEKSRREEDEEETGPGLCGWLARCPNPDLAFLFSNFSLVLSRSPKSKPVSLT